MAGGAGLWRRSLGTILGNLLAAPLLGQAFEGFGSGNIGVAGWVNATTLLGVPLVVALSALGPALRARSLSASEAISAGSTPHNGRGLRVQRWLTGTRLPRSVSLGLGMPLARPARSALTMASVVLGVASISLAMGLAKSLTWYDKAESRTEAVQVTLQAHRVTPGDPDSIPPGSVAATLSDAADEAMLRSLPGAAHVTASKVLGVRLTGASQHIQVSFYRDASAANLGYQVLNGHWPDGPGQVAVSERFLKQRGLAVGDNVALEHNGQRAQVRIVANVLMTSHARILSNWDTLALLSPGRAGQPL